MCVSAVACPSCPDNSPVPPGRGRKNRNMLGWTLEEKTDQSAVWLYPGCPSKGGIFSFPWRNRRLGKEADRTTQRVRSPVIPHALVRMRVGKAPLSGHILESGAGHCLPGLWRAIAPLMKPWRAEERSANRREPEPSPGVEFVCVGWHRDDEPLFGKCGDAKLIVSVSLGSSAVFRWRRQSCPDDEGHLCCLGHGDILVMGGQCQDEFLHRTDPGSDQERINLTFRCFLLSFV